MPPRRHDEEAALISEINVTPLVDITLVLLIIFMVTASLIAVPAIPLKLPEAQTGEPGKSQDDKKIKLQLTADGSLHLDGASTTMAAVELHIRSRLSAQPELQAVIGADEAVPHGKVVEVIDLVRRAGVLRFGISVRKKIAPDSR